MSSEIDPKTEIIGIINNGYLKEIRNIIKKGDHNTFITEYNKHKSIIEKYESNVKNPMLKKIKSLILLSTATTILNDLNEKAQSGNLNLEAIYKIINEKVKTKLSIKFDEIYNSIRSDIEENEKRIINEKYELVKQLYTHKGNGRVELKKDILESLEKTPTTLYTNQEVVSNAGDETIVKTLDEMTELGQYKSIDKKILITTLNGEEKKTKLYVLVTSQGYYPGVVGIDIYKARSNDHQQGGKRKSRRNRKTKKKSKRTNITKTPKKTRKPKKKQIEPNHVIMQESTLYKILLWKIKHNNIFIHKISANIILQNNTLSVTSSCAIIPNEPIIASLPWFNSASIIKDSSLSAKDLGILKLKSPGL